MTASHSDSSFLAIDANAAVFGNRVAAAIWSACISIANEAWSSTHLARKNFVAAILNNPAAYKQLFINAVSVDATVLSDATQAGTVVLSSANVAAQAALVTDAHIDNAISAAFNAFVSNI